ncbi:uncharacterized protein [Lolium perenne]|uniref:uncharacterized protein n=1 Tax=Lolium perenne TaxID=4522 RepID=UPI0021F57868|nr:uncharacterized protein LOC127339848 [Lolium perenne]
MARVPAITSVEATEDGEKEVEREEELLDGREAAGGGMAIHCSGDNAKKKKQPGNKNLRWAKPVSRQIKVNVDGSFLHDDHTGAVGAILRDHDGLFIAASTLYIPNLASAALAEAMALREGLSLAHRIGCNNVIAESDSLETVEACTGAEVWWGDSAAVFADCVDLMALIGSVQVQHCPREANGAAHALAKFCSSDKNSCNWVDEPPSFLLDVLVNDVTIP